MQRGGTLKHCGLNITNDTILNCSHTPLLIVTHDLNELNLQKVKYGNE